ncbi:hypothetical protein [Haloarcula marina]|uniref:hypothetical protein n=1 Tax=Haloarcula marina TaxID=2961574 RepID=UPI0020B6E92F|nr:hypothetical protein [Halomicroarcula marina]
MGLPTLNRYDIAALASVAGLLALAYVVVPDSTVQYGAWLLVFCIWMAWFVAFGARWLYGE